MTITQALVITDTLIRNPTLLSASEREALRCIVFFANLELDRRAKLHGGHLNFPPDTTPETKGRP